jgi:hypothetical protein
MTYHVHAAIGGGWAVRKTGSPRASLLEPTKAAAVRAAARLARSRRAMLVVHNRAGLICYRRNYGLV